MEAPRDDDELLADRYRLDRTVGHGGMAVVFSATDIILERQVAIKIFQRRRRAGAELHERFLREARAEAKIVAPEVVTVHDVGETADGRPFLVLEFVEGAPLSTLIGEGPSFDLERLAAIGADVARGLAAAHDLGIVHRDVKPANVMVEPTGRAKLGDFGLARVFDEEQAALTAPGTLVGSAHYVAPEQVRHGEASPRSDLYALGAMLYHVATGAPPFEGVAAMDIAMRRLEQPAPRLLDRRSDADPEFAGLIDDLLQRRPEHRPASAAQVAAELEVIGARLRERRTAAEAATLYGAPIPPPRPRRRTSLPRLTLAVPLAAAGRAAAAVRRHTPQVAGRLHAWSPPQPTRREAAIGAVAATALLIGVAALGAPHHPAPVAAARSVRPAAEPRVTPGPLTPRLADVRGRDALSATRALVDERYRVGLYAVRSSLPPGTVLIERPTPGSALGAGNVVTLGVAVGAAAPPAPRVPAPHRGRGGGDGEGGD